MHFKPRDLSSLGIGPIDVREHRFDRVREAVYVETEEASPNCLFATSVVLSQPANKGIDVGVTPHPAWKAAEGLARPVERRQMPHMAIERRCVRPVRLHCHDVEAVSFDEPPRDRRSRPVEFGGANATLRVMTGL